MARYPIHLREGDVFSITRIILSVFALTSMLLVCGCRTSAVGEWDALYENALVSDPSFPREPSRALTQFAHIGTVESSEGPLKIVWCKSVTTGMAAPRGDSWLAVFDSRNHYVGSVRPLYAPPLWCEGPRVFLFGVHSDGSEFIGDSGNVINFERGVGRRYFEYIPRYGSFEGNRDEATSQLIPKPAMRQTP